MSTVSIVFVLKDFGFPNGMASTQRVRLLAKCLVERGARVRVLCTTVSEEHRHPINTEVMGEADGIPFEYMPGKTQRAGTFAQRRLDQLRGCFRTLATLKRLRKQGEVDTVYLHGMIQSFTLLGLAYRLWAKVLGIRVIHELGELPWSLKARTSLLERTIHPLAGLDGVVAISHFLESWATREAKGTHSHTDCIRVPILVDEEEPDAGSLTVAVEKRFTFAASAAYVSTLAFILDALPFVWERYPDYVLSVTGCPPGSVAEAVAKDLLKRRRIGHGVVIEGYLLRENLLALYARSTALLIPLFDEIQSVARFPTKIGEYLMSGRPVVTTSVGEVVHFLVDGKSAFICSNVEPAEYAQAIMRAIEDPERALLVGQIGKSIARESFIYRLHGTALKQLAAGTQ